MTDPVNHPPHYTVGDIECIDAIKASMSQAEFEGYLKGAVLKYLWRFRYCLLYTSPSPRDGLLSRMPSSA